ncbi:PREDICTED: uncharacterized protein LOC109229147 isoform X1 [Nicotiana attenuata]|uniref:Uncharacterized protein n=1 Tax=Nicotiana attenuata TaxID=49451 RepID=A0A1J6IJJ4_NICAT|nr:PREDICTED: uncharacterized protein LOC109229147 isoform X1 [Nicotiana attenuata]OIT00696.1 hypothetical protein A4A49_20658 [Nicotiana attenuata]
MAALAQISINFLALNTPHNALYRKPNSIGLKLQRPIYCYTHLSTRKVSLWNMLRAFKEKSSFLTVKRDKNGILDRGEKRMVFVKFKQGFGFDGIGDGGGGGGGGGKDNSNTVRVVTNLVLAIGLTYLSMTGQLGWVLDAIVSVWLLAVLLPIVGLGAFIWWAGRDIVQGTCPNCGNDFQIFRSTLNDEVQLCPFCTQPFSVVGDEFVRDPVKFSNQSNTFGQAFSDFSARSKKGKDSTIGIVDIEAEVKDAE